MVGIGLQTLARRRFRDDTAHVDELHLVVGPVVVGGGTPIFDGQPAIASAHRPDRPFDSRQSLRLVGTRTWEGSGNVLVRYQVAHQQP
jgi:riboflavin biosynthesis pyrimidine reductase